MKRLLAVAAAGFVLMGLERGLRSDSLGLDLPFGRPTPWAEITATLLTVSLLLWAAVLRREE